jgi:glycosyltransferase involved in cell wall biosynthesis
MQHACFVINDFNFLLSHRLDLLIGLSKKIDITVICSIKDNQRNKIHYIKNQNISLIEVQSRKNIFDSFRYAKDLLNCIKPRFTHIFFITLEQSFFGSLLASKITNTKLFFVISGLGNNFFQKDLGSRIKNRFQNLILSSAFKKKSIEAVIFQNKDDIIDFKKQVQVFSTNCVLIRGNGIDLNNFSYDERNFERINFCYTGRLVKSKGLEELVNSFIKLSKKYNHLNPGLIICGIYDPNEKDLVSNNTISKIKTLKNIFYYKNLNHHEVIDILRNASVFVLPSMREGISKAALEGASTGLPLIAANTPGTRDVVQHNINGLHYEITDNNGLMRAMEKIIHMSKENLIDLGKASRSYVRKNFAINIIVDEYLKLILNNKN